MDVSFKKGSCYGPEEHSRREKGKECERGAVACTFLKGERKEKKTSREGYKWESNTHPRESGLLQHCRHPHKLCFIESVWHRVKTESTRASLTPANSCPSSLYKLKYDRNAYTPVCHIYQSKTVKFNCITHSEES